MEKATPIRKPHTSTSDLLTWKEGPPESFPETGTPVARVRPGQPSGSIAKVVFGGQVSEGEADSLLNRKPCSGSKLREMTGSGIFAAETRLDASESGGAISTPNNRTGLRMYQQPSSAISHISFSAEESVSPKKPTTLAEVAKMQELTGNLENESDTKSKKQFSNAKSKELSGNDIFGPPPEVPPRHVAAQHLNNNVDIGEPLPRNIHTSVKVSNPAGGPTNNIFDEEPIVKTSKKIHNQKVAELTGNDIFKGDTQPGPAGDKQLSGAKLREMNGSDIFADGKVTSREYYGGIRKPPGGESSIALV